MIRLVAQASARQPSRKSTSQWVAQGYDMGRLLSTYICVKMKCLASLSNPVVAQETLAGVGNLVEVGCVGMLPGIEIAIPPMDAAANAALAAHE